jgi:hypothetical protein
MSSGDCPSSQLITLCFHWVRKKYPKKVQSAAGAVNALEKCIWILRKKIHFSTTSALKPKCLKHVHRSYEIISEFKFPVLISVTATGTQCKHVAVIWDGVILDYEKKTKF